MTLEDNLVTATDNKDTSALLKQVGAKGILCAKCNHLNRPHSTKCSRCKSHLHIKCKDCGTRTERSQSECQTCGRRLHKSLFEKVSGGVFRQKVRITPMQVGWLIVFAAAAFYFVVASQDFKLPTDSP